MKLRQKMHAEALEDVACLGADLPSAGGDIVISVIFFIFNVRVGDRRTNGIGVGIAVA